MAIFTVISSDDARALLGHCKIGELRDLRGIAAGIENTNYFLDTTTGRYVLTVFERLGVQELPFYLALMRHLAARGLPVPDPAPTDNGALLMQLHGKPAAIVTRLPGSAIDVPTSEHCRLVGQTLAKMHVAARDLPMFQPNLRGIGWWKAVLGELEPSLDDDVFLRLAEEVIFQDSFFRSPLFDRLPSGPIHADLFRDNVLFDGTLDAPRLSGVIDFYFAGCSIWLYDVAVTVNDWCVDLDSGAFDPDRVAALLGAYHAARPLSDDEHQAWPTVLRAAALRFWISRLYDVHRPRPAQTLHPHDPVRFEKMLARRIAEADTAPWL